MIEIFYTAMEYEESPWEDFITRGDNKGIITIDTFDYFITTSVTEDETAPWKITTAQIPSEGLDDLPQVYYPPHHSVASSVIEFIVKNPGHESSYNVVLSKDWPLQEHVVNYVLFELNFVFDEEFVFKGRNNVYSVELNEEVVLIPSDEIDFVPLKGEEPEPIKKDRFDSYDYEEKEEEYVFKYGSREIVVDKDKVNKIEEY